MTFGVMATIVGVSVTAGGTVPTEADSWRAVASWQGRNSSAAARQEACALFTVEEVNEATGRTDYRRGRPRSEPNASSCSYPAGIGGTINVTLSPTSRKDFDDVRKLINEQGEKVLPAPGIGDDAYFWGNRIYVLVGSQALTIWNGDTMDVDPEENVRASLILLAKKGVSKLRTEKP